VLVFAGADSIVMDSVPGAEERLQPHLERYIINEDVQLHDRTSEWGELSLCGPNSAAILSEFAIDAASLPPCGHLDGAIAGAAVSIRRFDFTRQPGYLISTARNALGSVWESLRNVGAKPAGSEVFEALRIEALFPWYGPDISDDNLAQEVSRTSKAISFTKGCYLGQEPVARIDALGHANRELRGLKLETASVPQVGSKVLSPEGKEIGAVTSSAYSHGIEQAVALGYVRVPFQRPGSNVVIASADGANVPAEVFAGDAN
ncbi:MAG: folate-binding protein YgfZ, partial [Planctomycetaceae bacterium]